MAVFSSESIIFAMVFLTLSMVSRAAGFWYQHSLITLDTWVNIYKTETKMGSKQAQNLA